jgi:UDP-3-O-[3-hydroxymyristoyl] N-acetylglucosamine deacetylase/3-hydroxyacyl-[acyl-carrier-protein] dehydratase
VSLEGIGVHSGESSTLTFRPAEPGTGVRFRRTDLDGSPEIPATLGNVLATTLSTTLGAGEAKVLTVEHVMAATRALNLDNLLIEVSGPEVPILDGSFQDFAAALQGAHPVEQDAEARTLTVPAPMSIEGEAGASYVVAPGAGLRISATIDFDHPAIGRQFGSFPVDPESFLTEVAPARTFGFHSDGDSLHARGFALGASLENSVVLDDKGIMNEGLRFPDEFLRHKVGDLLGDLALLGARIDGHVVAERPGHEGNVALARALAEHIRRSGREPFADISQIMEFLPHRYPMLLVDRVLDFQPGERIVGMKNVTINEPFFQGHYPGHPIMPGVLIVEAMAQCGGLLLMDHVDDTDGKVVYFMSLDAVKWRRPVTPGDTLIFELDLVQFRRKICKLRGKAFVDGRLVAEANLMATIQDR